MDSIHDVKLCRRCDEIKNVGDFYIDRSRPDGVAIYCKVCTKAWQKEHYDPKYKQRQHRIYKEKTGTRPYKLSPEQRARKSANDKARRAANPERIRRERFQRKHRETNNGALGVTYEQWEGLCTAFGNKCLCCGSPETLSPDHIIPVRLGGIDHITNIQPLCRQCNYSKSDRHITDYRDRDILMAFLRTIFS